jgi:hypothetical protein
MPQFVVLLEVVSHPIKCVLTKCKLFVLLVGSIVQVVVVLGVLVNARISLHVKEIKFDVVMVLVVILVLE